MDLRKSNVKIFCRLCLNPSKRYRPLFENETVEMLKSLTSMKITYDDKAPNLTCFRCLVEMKHAYKTQQRLIKTEKFLQDMVIQNKIKEEVESKCETFENSIKCEVVENAETRPEEEHCEESDELDNKNQIFLDCSANEYDIENNQMKELFIFPTVLPECELKETGESAEQEFEEIGSASTKKRAFYKCMTCLEGFDNISHYHQHLNSHSMRQCCMCPKFIASEELRQHNRIHECGYCEYCGLWMKNSGSLRTHVRLQHQNKLYDFTIRESSPVK